MEELQDYSGEFRPNLKMVDFSKEQMSRIWSLGGFLYLGLGSVYYRVLKERLGEEKAMELDFEVWKRMALTEIRLTAQAANIHGDDVATIFKIFQCDPAGGIGGDSWADIEYDLKSDRHGIATFKDCKSLRYFEKHGEMATMEHVCTRVDVDWYNQCAQFVNPKIKVTPLKLPPRKSPDEIACQWEFKLESY